MSNGFWPGPTPCNVCSAMVFYTRGRRRCRGCQSWCHEGCILDDRGHSLCLHCARRSPGKIFRRIAADMNGGKEDFPALEVVLWSCVFGQDEEEISAKLGLPPEKVREWGDRLRANRVWEDGRVNLGEHDRSDPRSQSIIMILIALLADGLIEREPVDSADALVPREGGTEQDGNQEYQTVPEA